MAESRLLSSPEFLAEVGRAAATKLSEVGITNLAELIAAGPDANEAAGGPERLNAWRAAALLLTLDEMTPRLAAALVREGVDSPAELVERSLRRVEQIAEVTGPNPPSVYDLAALQLQACRRRGTGMLAVQVSNRAGRPITSALVRVAGQRGETDRKGWAAFDAVREGMQRVEVQPPGLLVPYGLASTIEEGRLFGPVRFRVPARRKGRLANVPQRQSEGALVTNRHVTATRIETVPFSSVPKGAYLVVLPPLESGRVPLVSLDKVRAGLELQITRTVVDAAELPAGVAERSLVYFDGDSLALTDKTPGEVTSSWLKLRRRQIRTIGPSTSARSSTAAETGPAAMQIEEVNNAL